MSQPTVVELEMLWFAYLDNDISQLYVKANYDHCSTQLCMQLFPLFYFQNLTVGAVITSGL